VLAPTIVLWASTGFRGLRVRSAAWASEAAILFVGLLLVGGLTFGSRTHDADLAPVMVYLPVPLLVWAAVRFGPRGLMSALSLVTLVVIAAMANDQGPAIAGSTAANVLNLQLFLLGVGVPLFVLAALVREREDAQVDLKRSDERYRAVVSNFPRGAVLLFGPDLRHLFADGQGLPGVGLSRESIEGKTVWEAFPADMASALAPHYQAALAGVHASFDLGHAGRTYRAEVLPINFAGSPTGMMVMQDVTEERRAEVLAELDRAKTAFFSNVSHEFRTPLTGIQAFSELIRDKNLPVERIKEFAADINREAERLNRMIEELLDLDRMESGRMVLHLEQLDLNALVGDVVAGTRPTAPQHALDLALDPTLPLLWGDRDKLTQALLNLLNNAIKYSPQGGEVTVGTRLTGGEAHLWVRDQGVGIPPEALDVVFERYARVESGPQRYIKGTGLGLPIVRQIAQLHGGRAWAESAVRQGSTFYVALPLAGPARQSDA
jgi:signal transduction histidine kinase